MLFKEIKCPLCGGSSLKVLKPAAQISPEKLQAIYKSSSETKLFERVVECSSCSLVYLNPILESDFIVNSYKDAVDDTFITQNQCRIETFKSSLREIASYVGIDFSKKKTKVLDVGCAGGAFVKAAHDLGAIATGVEPSAYLSAYARKQYGLDVRTGILSEQKFEKKSFDLITMWDVVEHLTDPNQVISEMHGLLRDDGYIVINYPDFTSVVAKLMGWKWPFWLSVHLTYFDKKTIAMLLEKNGFEVLRYRMHWQKLEFGYLLHRAAQYFKFFNLLEPVVRMLGLSKLPFYYYLGQIQVVAKAKQ